MTTYPHAEYCPCYTCATSSKPRRLRLDRYDVQVLAWATLSLTSTAVALSGLVTFA